VAISQGRFSQKGAFAMPAAVTVRTATEADLPTILTLIEELATYEVLRHECVATVAALQTHLFGTRPAAEVLLAEIDGAPAGFALFFTSFSTFLAQPCLHLEDLFVRPAQRQHGIGRALLQALARLGGERGCGRIGWHVLTWNKLAIDFYDRLGASRLDDWAVYRLDETGMNRLAETTR
jgi:GNAT superfamily N-acetyltransferase